MQGAVINVITRQGGDRFLYDASYYGQTAGLTSQPVLLAVSRRRPADRAGTSASGTATSRRTSAVRSCAIGCGSSRGYQHLRDYDSQPGTDPAFPRTYEQDKIFAKLTWRLAPGLQLVQSFHDEFWVNPELPTLVKPFEATQRRHASVPAMTFGHLTHTLSSNTVWDVRVGRFVYHATTTRAPAIVTTPSRFDRVTGVSSGAPQTFGGLHAHSHDRQGDAQPLPARAARRRSPVEGRRRRSNGASTSCPRSSRPASVRRQQRAAVSGRSRALPPTPAACSSRPPAFVSDAITVGQSADDQRRLRFDHSRAISQDLPALDAQGRETDDIVRGLGTLYTWNVWSPRLGVTTKLTARRPDDAAGELRAIQSGRADRRARAVPSRRDADHDDGVRSGDRRLHDARLGRRSRRRTCGSIPTTRTPHTDEYSIGVDREVGRGSRWRSRTSARTAATSSAGPTSAVSIARRRGRCRRPQRAGVRARQRARPIAASC